jgi:Uma2 family endonuclease
MSAVLTPEAPEAVEEISVPKGYELVDGELREMPASTESSWVAGEVFGRLWEFNRKARVGWVFPQETIYRCFPPPRKTARKPDASFVRLDRLGAGPLPRTDLRLVPDLAVEVISPNDTANDLFQKIEDYRAVGVPLIWVIDPIARFALVYRADGTVTNLHEPAALDGEDVLPGFTWPLADILPPPVAAPT